MEPKSLFSSWSFAVNEERTLPAIQQRAHERVWNELYWMNENSSVPWIIGETSLTATGNSLFTDIMAEGIGGNLTNQLDYAAFTLNATCSCGGSGYSWWQYQDGYWFASNGGTRFFGLLERGFNPSTAAEKPAVNAVFRPFVPPLVGTTGPCPINYSPTYNQSLVYYDPYRTSDYNTSGTNAVSGYVTDDNNDPIQDAVVLAGNYLTKTGTGQNTIYVYNIIYTLSDENGFFQIIPYNFINANQSKITGLKITFLGSKKEEQGNFDDIALTNLSQPVTLEQTPFHYDEEISNALVAIGESKKFKGWNSIQFSGSNTIDGTNITGGIAAISARSQIDLMPGFTAKNGSEISIYCSNTFSDCDDYIGYRPSNQTNNSSLVNHHGIKNKKLELQFSIPEQQVEIYPNPSSGIFTINFLPTQNNILVKITILNTLGQKVKIFTTNTFPMNINTVDLAKGLYFVQLKSAANHCVKKLIIN